MRGTFIYFLLLVGAFALNAQHIPERGVPQFDNYPPADYHHFGKIWDIASAPNAIIYMAADEGLLEFDGQTWRGFKGSAGFTRSVFVASDSVLYSGSDRDFGRWQRVGNGTFSYTSLYPFRKDPNEVNEEFWGVYGLADAVVFVSFDNIYLYKNQQLTKVAAPSRFSGSWLVDGQLYLADEDTGLYLFNGISLKPVLAYPEGKPLAIAGVFSAREGLMIVTQKEGLFRLQGGSMKAVQGELSDRLKAGQVFSFTKVQDNYLAFGTILSGLYLATLEGRILQHIDKQKGLPNNTILSLHYSPNNTLWLGMDYGITAINLFDGFGYFLDYKGQFGTCYAALLKDDIFYLGTNQGLYKASWQRLSNDFEPLTFSLVKGSEGQVWTLQAVDGKVLCGHDKGLFEVVNNELVPIYLQPGIWTISPYKEEAFLLVGHYNGIAVLQKTGNGFRFLKKVPLILGSCNQLIAERDSVFWVNIPNFGLIRFKLKANFETEERVIFPDSLFQGNSQRLYATQLGIELLTSTHRYLFDPAAQQFKIQDTAPTPLAIQGLLKGTYQPIALNEEYQLFPIYNGFVLRQQQEAVLAGGQGSTPPVLLLRSMEAFNNRHVLETALGGEIPYVLNNLKIRFLVANAPSTLYRYRLLPDEEAWSQWSPNNQLELLHLHEGRYTLELEAKTTTGAMATHTVAFTVLAPWYRSFWAYLSYLILVGGVFMLNRQWQRRQLNRQKRELVEKEKQALQQQALSYEQAAQREKQERLEEERRALKQQIRQKNIELAKQAKDNEDKNRLLLLLKEKIQATQNNPSISKAQWAEMERLLDLYLESESHAFEMQIDELHQAFFNGLRTQYTDLSLYDLRLCAYLKLGLNSKEIADLLNVLPSSINVSRSRLRKKLNLEPDEDLYRFLNDIKFD